jgi:hypothetical protein
MIRTVTCALLCALLLLPAGAQAAPGSDTTVEAAEFSVLNRAAGSAAATCPAGSRVVGGGVDTTGPTPVGAALPIPYQVLASGPRDESGEPTSLSDGDIARQWYAYVWNGENGEQRFKVFALCSRTSDATIEATSVTVAAGASAQVTAPCPGSSRVVGGGVDASSPPRPDGAPHWAQLSGPRDTDNIPANLDDGDIASRWHANMRTAAEAGTQNFKVYALCSSALQATAQVAELPLGARAAGTASAACPAGSRVTGGGVDASGPSPDAAAPLLVLLSSPLDETGLPGDTADGDVARQWRGYVRNSTAAERVFEVIALCAREEAGGGGGGATRRCAGKRATIVGTSGRDVLRGTRRRDVIAALGGNDRVVAGAGNDIVCGGSGNDRVSGGRGNDRLIGQGGRDVLTGQRGRDKCEGGSGRDKASCERKRGI